MILSIDVTKDERSIQLGNLRIELDNVPDSNGGASVDELRDRVENLEVRLADARRVSEVEREELLKNVRSILAQIADGRVFSRDNKITCIKMVRELTSHGLKEAKDLVDEYIV
jgi:ribosomal protein L7/L12